jgi:hypothetical protein
MRFNNDAYLKAFPREDKIRTTVEVGPGNVIEEAEAAQPIKKAAAPEAPGNVIEDAATPADPAPEEAAQEGADNGS